MNILNTYKLNPVITHYLLSGRSILCERIQSRYFTPIDFGILVKFLLFIELNAETNLYPIGKLIGCVTVNITKYKLSGIF